MARRYLTLIKRRINLSQKTLQSSCIIWLSASFNCHKLSCEKQELKSVGARLQRDLGLPSCGMYQSLNIPENPFSCGPASLFLTVSAAACKCDTPKENQEPSQTSLVLSFCARDKARSTSSFSSMESFSRTGYGILGTGGICLQEACQPAAACSASAGLLIT